MIAPCDAEWDSAIAFADRTQLTLYLRGAPGLPARVEAAIETRRAKNLKRRARLIEAVGEAARALERAGIEFVALKGLTHESGFGICGEDRVQYDIDLWCSPEDRGHGARVLCGIGYAPRPGPKLSGEHARPMVRPSEWTWRGDYYDPDMPIPVELHDSLWDALRDRIRIDVSGFWTRKVTLETCGLRIPALAEVDRAGFAALHVLRHVLRNDARPAAALELARFLQVRNNDDLFWNRWREWHDVRLRELEAVGFRFAVEWFGGIWPPLPVTLETWFRMYAWSPVDNLTRPNKDALWLHLALLEKWSDRARVLLRRLAPLRVPHEPVAERIRYHVSALAPALWSGLRFWQRRQTVSTASQISD